MSEYDTAPGAPGFEQVDPICLCGDPKSQHRLGRRGCKALDCGCGEFEESADIEPSPGFLAVDPDAVVRKQLRIQGLSPDTPEFAGAMAAARSSEQSTSARLREVEAELADTNAAYEALAAELAGARTEMASLRKNEEIRAQVIRERNKERVELAADLAKVREQRDALVARVDELEQLAEFTEQHVRDMQDDGVIPPVEIHGWDAFQCFTCGSRYRRNFDHTCGPLKPVRVSITER